MTTPRAHLQGARRPSSFVRGPTARSPQGDDEQPPVLADHASRATIDPHGRPSAHDPTQPCTAPGQAPQAEDLPECKPLVFASQAEDLSWLAMTSPGFAADDDCDDPEAHDEAGEVDPNQLALDIVDVVPRMIDEAARCAHGEPPRTSAAPRPGASQPTRAAPVAPAAAADDLEEIFDFAAPHAERARSDPDLDLHDFADDFEPHASIPPDALASDLPDADAEEWVFPDASFVPHQLQIGHTPAASSRSSARLADIGIRQTLPPTTERVVRAVFERSSRPDSARAPQRASPLSPRPRAVRLGAAVTSLQRIAASLDARTRPSPRPAPVASALAPRTPPRASAPTPAQPQRPTYPVAAPRQPSAAHASGAHALGHSSAPATGAILARAGSGSDEALRLIGQRIQVDPRGGLDPRRFDAARHSLDGGLPGVKKTADVFAETRQLASVLPAAHVWPSASATDPAGEDDDTVQG